MSNVALPNVRKLFIPSPSHLLVDADLSGADAQVVAWEAEDEELKDAFRKGLKVHVLNARALFPHTASWSVDALKATDKPGGVYWAVKRGVHGTNYGASARTIAIATGWTVKEAERFQSNWFGLHPGIKTWHDRTEQSLATTRGVANRFGFRVKFFDRIDAVFPEALAWVPQSTVAIACLKGALALRAAFRSTAKILLQVHDSLVFEIHKTNHHLLPSMLETLRTPIPYSDPLTIAWGVKVSEKSWGEA